MSPLDSLTALIHAEEYAAASRLAMQHLKSNPDDLEFVLSAAEVFLDSLDHHSALKLLRKAEMRFKHHPRIMELLGDAHWYNEDFDRSEQWFRRALNAYPGDDRVSRSRCMTGLGDALWDQKKKLDAFDLWHTALALDPSNLDASGNLDNFSNEYGEPAALNSMFDDLNKFTAIHMEKWLKANGGDAPQSKKKLNDAMGALVTAYNAHVAPLGATLDAMTTEEKIRVFESVNVDWDATLQAPLVPQPEVDLMNPEPFDDEDWEMVDELVDMINNREYDFLPPGGMSLAIHARAALEAVDIDRDRAIEIIRTGIVTEKEKVLFRWATALAMLLSQSIIAKTEREARTFIKDALALAHKVLVEKEDAAEIVQDVMNALIADLIDNENDDNETIN